MLTLIVDPILTKLSFSGHIFSCLEKSDGPYDRIRYHRKVSNSQYDHIGHHRKVGDGQYDHIGYHRKVGSGQYDHIDHQKIS